MNCSFFLEKLVNVRRLHIYLASAPTSHLLLGTDRVVIPFGGEKLELLFDCSLPGAPQEAVPVEARVDHSFVRLAFDTDKIDDVFRVDEEPRSAELCTNVPVVGSVTS